jgi:hypothetical protein
MTERDPKIDPKAGDVVKGVELFKHENLDLIYRPYYNVLIARKALFAVTGPKPRKLTTYGNVLYEKLGVREHFDGSIKNKPPYGHCYLVTIEEWRELVTKPEPTVEGVNHGN